MNEIDRARSALQFLDPGCDRETWVKIGMAAKAAGLTEDEWVEWSTPAHNFGGERDCRAVWRSFKPGVVTEKTLFHFALNAGWPDPARTRTSGYRRVAEPGQRQLAPTQMSSLATSEAVLGRWNQCTPATAEHPYIAAKRGLPDGLRVVPDDTDWTINGRKVAGCLVIPAISPDGEICTMQLVPPPGAGIKLNVPGAAFGDGYFIVGDAATSACLYVAEGIGQAWACTQASGCAAVVTFGAGRMLRIAALLRDRFPSKRIVLVPDRGKEAEAESIARTVAAGWVEIPKEKPANYDVNDLAAEHGLQALAELLASPNMPSMRYRLLDGLDLLNAPPLPWMVRGVLPQQGLASVFGASGSGKSFLALDLCAAVAGGVDWFRCRVTQAPVVYVALEGETGFSQRIKAWQTKHGCDVPAGLRFVMQPFDLRERNDLSDLAEAIKASGSAGGLLVIDTLNRAASGADENSSSDMGSIICAAKDLQTLFGGLVMLVHHSGKDQSKGLRGHSSLHAALDSAVEVSRSDNRRSWRIAKSKDDGDSIEHPFRLEIIAIGQHDDGEPITSCVVVPDGGRTELRRAPPPKGGNQRVAWQAIADLARATSNSRPNDAQVSAPENTPILRLEAVIDAIRQRLVCEDKRRTERAQQALTGLQARGLVAVERGYVWML